MTENAAPMDETLQERQLVRRMNDGEAAAFDEFVEHYTPALLRYAQGHLTGHPEAVPDIVQSTLVVAVERFDTFRGDGALGAWLLSICRFQIATYWRRLKVRKRWAAEGPVELDSLESTGESPGQSLERHQRNAGVHAILELLPGSYGNVLEWKYLEEISVQQIAERLGVSSKAAESTLSRARAAFRRLHRAEEAARSRPGAADGAGGRA
ncbi:MAG: sigma-70 family RNA polymerase sigma factor [Acidobacteriota bacterium]